MATRIVALLTGRGNNTLKDKNILPVFGKPLLSYPALAAKQVQEIDKFYVSSDDEKILNIAHSLGYQKIKRPSALAQADSKHIDVINHALNVIQFQECFMPEILIVLLANSATIKPEWLQQAISMIKSDDKISAVVPVSQDQDHHPYRAKRLDTNGSLEAFFDFGGMEVSTNRQELVPCYFLCHNFWVLNVQKSLFCKNGQKPWVFLGDNIKPIIVKDCFDVHKESDLKKSEEWLCKNMQANGGGALTAKSIQNLNFSTHTRSAV
ncbi:cytidylyltransferase domain-containing protein [Helicobacter himalayensis]|uniref:acylneuraminate cytidylyltransferase family protein n=1 Tax=Helicobacter himalayensis TaxID=1591088 RepID=UPI003D6F9B66